MRALASSFSAWRLLEQQEGTKVPHGLVYSLAVVGTIGQPHGLNLVAEESLTDRRARDFDAVFISVLDSRCMIGAAQHFDRWGLPLDRRARTDSDPLVWAGGQGLANPRPFDLIADLIVVGDAEQPLPALLALWNTGARRQTFLEQAAGVPGVYVPSVHDPAHDRVQLSVSDVIDASLRDEISVSLDGTRRIEIARGCRYKCTFCSLGWRAPVRENTSADVITQIRRSPKRVHLQAGDAESHSGIGEIRAALADHGGIDQGWTGRLDTLLLNPDVSTPGSKRYAFGVEGVSHRLRRAFGKGYLTDERLIADTLTFLDSIEGPTVGRTAWHMISGLPAERDRETLDLARVVTTIQQRRRGKTKRKLSLHWQPFQPLPWTPAQWFGAGAAARAKIDVMRSLERDPWLLIEQLGGRTDSMAKVCTVLSRSSGEGALRLLASLRTKVTPEQAEDIAGVGFGPLELEAPLPWDFIDGAYTRAQLRRAFDVCVARLDDRK